MQLIKLQNVAKSFSSGSRKREVLRNINLDVRAGEFVAIVGYSGSGKSTLMALLAGLTMPDCGQVLFIHSALVDRVRTTLRWAAVNPYDETQIRNMVRYYTESPAEGADPYLGMTEAQVQVTRLDAGLATERIRIAVVNYPYHFFTPVIARTFTNNLAVVETLPSEYRP